MKKIIATLIACVMICSLLSGCVTINVNADDIAPIADALENGDFDDLIDMVNEDADEDADEDEDYEPEEYPDPLEGYDVIYNGTKSAGDYELFNLVNIFIQSTDADPEEILLVNVDDFENNGKYEAFIFVGTENEDEYDVPYEGTMWFVGDGICKEIVENANGWWSIDGILEFDDVKYVYVNEYYATGALSYIWEVKNGEPVETDISRMGEFYQDDEGDLHMIASMYDGVYDADLDGFLGHTWKEYYFFYDEEEGRVIEYGGVLVTKEQIDELAGFDLYEQIEAKGVDIGEAYYRSNGILNINYSIDDGFGGASFNNVNYDCINEEYINAYGVYDIDPMDASSYGGTYQAISYVGCPVMYPEL